MAKLPITVEHTTGKKTISGYTNLLDFQDKIRDAYNKKSSKVEIYWNSKKITNLSDVLPNKTYTLNFIDSSMFFADITVQNIENYLHNENIVFFSDKYSSADLIILEEYIGTINSNKDYVFISGNKYSGKTSVLKAIYLKYFDPKSFPLVINWANYAESDLERTKLGQFIIKHYLKSLEFIEAKNPDIANILSKILHEKPIDSLDLLPMKAIIEIKVYSDSKKKIESILKERKDYFLQVLEILNQISMMLGFKKLQCVFDNLIPPLYSYFLKPLPFPVFAVVENHYVISNKNAFYIRTESISNVHDNRIIKCKNPNLTLKISDFMGCPRYNYEFIEIWNQIAEHGGKEYYITSSMLLSRLRLLTECVGIEFLSTKVASLRLFS